MSGSFNYANAATAKSGNVRIAKDQYGIVSVGGQLVLPGKNSGDAKVTVNASRFFIFAFYFGDISVVDQSAGVAVQAPIFGSVAQTGGVNAVTSTNSWFSFGTFPDLIKPFTVRWTVDDVA